MDNELLAPCGTCPRVTDKEIGYQVGTSVMLFKTFNGSSRYVYQVQGRNVAVLLVASHSSHLGRVVAAYALPDYSNSGLFGKLYAIAKKDYKTLRLGNELESCAQVVNLIHEIKGV